jgi:hypothetical protein
MSHCLTPTKVVPLAPDQATALMRDGYLLLRGAVPAAWRDALRAAFDAGVGTGDQWAGHAAPAGTMRWSIGIRRCSGPAACRRCWRRERKCWAVRSGPAPRPHRERKPMNRPRPTYLRNSLDLRDKVQVKVLRKRLNLSNDRFAEIFRKSGNSISAIAKEAAISKPGAV